MLLLDRYLQRQLYTMFALLLAGITGVFLLIDFFERIDNFIARGLPFALAVRYFLMKLPFMVEQVIPLIIMLGGVITLGLVTMRRELLSLQAAGVCARRVIYSLLVGALGVSALAIGLEEWLLPPGMMEANRIWSREVKQESIDGAIRAGKIFYRGQTGIYTFKRPTGDQQEFPDFAYTAWDSDYRVTLQVTAALAHWQQSKGWILQEGMVKRPSPDGTYAVESFTMTALDLPETPGDLFVPHLDPDTLSLSALLTQSSSRDQLERRKAGETLHRKLSYLFLGIPLLTLALPFLLFLQGRWRLDLSLAVPLCCALAYLVWIFWGALQSYSRAGLIDPLLASWLLPFTLMGIGLYWSSRNPGRT